MTHFWTILVGSEDAIADDVSAALLGSTFPELALKLLLRLFSLMTFYLNRRRFADSHSRHWSKKTEMAAFNTRDSMTCNPSVST